MKIKEFSQESGLSSHTLRYYEKIGLLTNINRNRSGNRIYNAHDLDWVNWIKCLKNSGMSIESIQSFAQMQANNDFTSQIEILEQHNKETQKKIDELNEHVKNTQLKIIGLRDLT